MKQKNRARSSSLFLMELILAILFFSVASAVCVEFFVKSHLLNLESNALTHSVNECSGVAEILSSVDDLTEGLTLLQEQYPNGQYPDLDELDDLIKSQTPTDVLTEGNGAIRIYYDESFLACTEASAAYTLDIRLTYSGQMVTVIQGMYKKDALLPNNISDAAADHASDIDQAAPIYQLETKHHIARRTDTRER